MFQASEKTVLLVGDGVDRLAVFRCVGQAVVTSLHRVFTAVGIIRSGGTGRAVGELWVDDDEPVILAFTVLCSPLLSPFRVLVPPIHEESSAHSIPPGHVSKTQTS